MRGKVLTLIFITFAVYGTLDYCVQRFFILPSFTTLENEEAIKDMGRAVQAIAREVEHLGSSVADWALWDDTYQYTQDRNDEYREANLNELALIGLKINIMYIFDKENRLVWGMVYDIENEEQIRIDGLEQLITGITFSDELETVGGVLLTANGPILVSAKPVLTSNSEGPPRGYIVMGQFLNTGSISEQARITLQATPLNKGMSGQAISSLVEKVQQQDEPYIQEEERVNRVFSVLPDITGKPALLLEVQVPRSITARGKQAVSFALVSLLGASVIIMVLLIVVIQKMVLNPLQQLTSHTVDIGERNDLSARLSEARSDEIGILSKEFNRMIAQLETARKNLMDQSYQSGRAEVAVSVLHSVGNALNGVVLSSYQLLEKAKRTSVGDVSKMAGLLQEQEADLAKFFTEDPRGQMVPHYLTSLASVLEEERQQMMKEAVVLQERVDTIKEIISRQQDFSKQARVRETEHPEELLEDALKLSFDQRVNTAIEIERDYRKVSRIKVDRHKVMQILLNLINNARSACMESDRQDKKIILRLFPAPDDRVVMQVVDNGIGIPAESLDRIFEQGFTTRKGGQGLGLHTCSLAAAELGGKLTVKSDGRDCGTTSTLELPCPTNEKQ